MGIRLNREIKAYCPDFKPVRSLLQGLEAVFIEVKHQTDFFYHLPPDVNVAGTRRLKLRVEEGKRRSSTTVSARKMEPEPASFKSGRKLMHRSRKFSTLPWVFG